MSDLVGNPEDRFSHNKAQIVYHYLYVLATRVYLVPPKCLLRVLNIHVYVGYSIERHIFYKIPAAFLSINK